MIPHPSGAHQHRFDANGDGAIDASELSNAFAQFGYQLSPEFSQLCVKVFDYSSNANKTLKFEHFIQCCVMVRTLTDSFKRRDEKQRGVAGIDFEQFLEMVFENQLAGV